MWERIETRGRRYMVKRDRRGQITAKVTWGDYLRACHREQQIKRSLVREVGKVVTKAATRRWLKNKGWTDYKDIAELLIDCLWER